MSVHEIARPVPDRQGRAQDISPTAPSQSGLVSRLAVKIHLEVQVEPADKEAFVASKLKLRLIWKILGANI